MLSPIQTTYWCCGQHAMNNIKIENLCHMNDNSIRLIRKMRTLCVTIPMYKYNDLPFFTVCCIYLVLELLVLGAMFFCIHLFLLYEYFPWGWDKSSACSQLNRAKNLAPKRWKTEIDGMARVILRTMGYIFRVLKRIPSFWKCSMDMENGAFEQQKRFVGSSK